LSADFGTAGGGAGAPRVGHEHVRHILERRAVETAARERDRGVPAVALFHVREIQQSVAREVRMQHDGVHAACVQRIRRPAGDRFRIEFAAAHDAHISGKLRHEHVGATRQERHVPGAHESVRDRHDVNSHELARGAATVQLAVRRTRARRVSVERPVRVIVLRTRQRRRAQQGNRKDR
jgi:hypothetical protein